MYASRLYYYEQRCNCFDEILCYTHYISDIKSDNNRHHTLQTNTV